VGAVGPGAHKSCHISEMVQDRTETEVNFYGLTGSRIPGTCFRLAPKSMTLDDLERPKRHSCRNKQNFRSLNSFRIKIRAKYSGRKHEKNWGE